MKNELIIKKIRPAKLKEEVTFIFDYLEVPQRVTRKDKVFIKPNIFCREPAETGATIDLRLLGVVIDYFIALGKPVLVGEAGANQYAQTRMFEELGLAQFCRVHQAEFINLNECATEPIELKIKGKSYSFKAPVLLLYSPFLVDMPKFKTHLSTRVSWAIKNLYGLLPDKEKWLGHQIGINETLIALSQRFSADVVLMDGIIAMKGLGPTMGLPEEKNLLFGARDQFVHDLGLLHLLDIKHVPHIEQCTNGQPLEISYQFLNEDGCPVEAQSLGIELRLPPLLFNRIFIRSNQIFFTLAPKLERFFDPKIILNLMVKKQFIGFIRRVQKVLKV
jgi:uncharacterized protein (DUF362 family)